MELKELQNKLKKFRYTEKAELTDEETKTLEKMFSVPNAFHTLYKFLLVNETDRGTQIMYDIEAIPTTDDGHTDKTSADAVRFQKMMVRYVRMKMEDIRVEFEGKYSKLVGEEEKRIKEVKEKNEEKRREEDIRNSGVNKDL